MIPSKCTEISEVKEGDQREGHTKFIVLAAHGHVAMRIQTRQQSVRREEKVTADAE